MATRKTSQKKLYRSLDANHFYSDLQKEDTLYGALVRSPASSGKIKDITISDLPEGYYLFTAKDLPGAKDIKVFDTTSKIFCYDNISYTGEPVGIIVGPEENRVIELLENVSVNLDVENLESALHNVINNQTETGNNFKDFVDQINEMPSLDTVIDKSQTEEEVNVTVASREIKYGLYENLSIEEAEKEIFSKASFTTEDTWKQKLSSPKWQETEGAYCHMEGSSLHVYTPSRWIYFTQKTIADVFGLKIENVYIHRTKNSGIFPTGLWRTTQIALQAVLPALILKKPVKLVFTQSEQDSYMSPGVKTEIKYKTAINENGILEGMNVNIAVDIGTANPFAQEIIDRLCLAVTNYYRPKNLYIHAYAKTSKNPPTSVSIKVVDSQAFFAIENEIQKICNQTNMLPDEIRSLNSESLKKQNKDNPFPFEIQIDNKEEVLQTVLKKSDFNRKYASFHMEAIDRIGEDSKPFFALPLRGIGVATGYAISGFNGSTYFPNNTKIEVTFNTDDKLVIHSNRPSEVIQEIWKNTASEILQIPKQNITIDSNFSIEDLPQTPEDTNNSIGMMNDLIKKCCVDIQKKRFHQPLPISSKKMIAKTPKSKWDSKTFRGIPFITTSFAATAVEVELDTYTYSEKIKGIWMVINCGEVFDEAAAIRTIRLEIQQELAMLVSGKTVSCDQINISFVKSNTKSGQVNGLVHNTLPAAFSSALSLALATQVTALPCTEKQLFKLIKNRVVKATDTGDSK